MVGKEVGKGKARSGREGGYYFHGQEEITVTRKSKGGGGTYGVFTVDSVVTEMAQNVTFRQIKGK